MGGKPSSDRPAKFRVSFNFASALPISGQCSHFIPPEMSTFNTPLTELLHVKCPYSEFFWSVISPYAGKCGPEKLRIRTIFM